MQLKLYGIHEEGEKHIVLIMFNTKTFSGLQCLDAINKYCKKFYTILHTIYKRSKHYY
jgi:hypothetical protein